MANIKTKSQTKPETFLKDLLSTQGSLNSGSDYLAELRAKGADEVNSMSMPKPKDEEWRFISLRDLYRDNYISARDLELSQPDLSEYFIPESEGARLVFLNGTYSPEHSSVDALPEEMVIGNLATIASDNNPILENHLNQYADFEDDLSIQLYYMMVHSFICRRD
jgi:Fe-S cluster assembly protein SufD